MRATVTLREVAAEAGVSISTVSRILDERLPTSHSANAQRVRDAAVRLGYRRDVAAASLRRSSSGTIGVLVPRLSDQVMALMFEALYEEAARRGQFALVSVNKDDPGGERRAVEALLDRRVDGLVLAATRLSDDLPEELRRRHVPHVLALRTDGASPSSVCDDELGGYLATRHLLDLGHHAIAAMPGPNYTSTANGRLTGYRRAMAEAGIDVPRSWVSRSGFNANEGERVGTALLSSHPEVSAVFAANDDLALGVVDAAAALGRSVPEDLSIVGYNDTPLAARLPVPLTSVRVPFDAVAAGALDLLEAFRTRLGTGSDHPGPIGAQGPHTETNPPVTFDFGTLRVATPTLIPRGSSVALRP